MYWSAFQYESEVAAILATYSNATLTASRPLYLLLFTVVQFVSLTVFTLLDLCEVAIKVLSSNILNIQTSVETPPQPHLLLSVKRHYRR